MPRASVRAAAALGGAAALFVGVVGFAHTPAGRPLLAALGRVAHGGCPLGYDRAATPADRERAARAFAKAHPAERRALSRPALGFVLDETTSDQVLARMSAHGVTCRTSRGMADLTCNGVPASALPGASPGPATRNLWFTFGERHQLLSVVALSRAPEAAPISDAFLTTERTLGQLAGAASVTRGSGDPDSLAAGTLARASAEFRFANYYAAAQASNLGHGFLLTEEYRSLPD